MAHRCPRWCHKCPDLVEIVAERDGDTRDPMETTMPWCMGGVMYGLGGCHCVVWEPRRATDDRKAARSVASRTERIALLRELIEAYPAHARHLVAKHAPPKEQTPELKAVR